MLKTHKKTVLKIYVRNYRSCPSNRRPCVTCSWWLINNELSHLCWQRKILCCNETMLNWDNICKWCHNKRRCLRSYYSSSWRRLRGIRWKFTNWRDKLRSAMRRWEGWERMLESSQKMKVRGGRTSWWKGRLRNSRKSRVYWRRECERSRKIWIFYEFYVMLFVYASEIFSSLQILRKIINILQLINQNLKANNPLSSLSISANHCWYSSHLTAE